MHKSQPIQESNQALLARVKKEMDEPRMAESTREEYDVSVRMFASRSPNEILGGRAESHAYDVRLFSMTSRTLFDRLAWCCSQICNCEFLRDQQSSTTRKIQPADSKGDKLYTRKVTHLIPNQIQRVMEIC